jgi:hypothetical protein
MIIPKIGTLERLLFDKLITSESGVTFLDFVGTGITEENIGQIIQNLQHGMYDSEMDSKINFDS